MIPSSFGGGVMEYGASNRQLVLILKSSKSKPRAIACQKEVISIGRKKGNDIVLTDDHTVSGRHALLKITPEGIEIEDLNSSNGVYVEGTRIEGSARIDVGTRFTIGQFTMVLRERGALQRDARPAPKTPPEQPPSAHPVAESAPKPAPERPVAHHPAAALTRAVPFESEMDSLPAGRFAEAAERLELDEADHSDEDAGEAAGAGDVAVEELSPVDRVIRSFLYPIDDLLDDPTVSEVMINGFNEIYVERSGRLVRTDRAFDDESYLEMGITNIARTAGTEIDEAHPILDACLADGTRVFAVLPPAARNGITIHIRKPPGAVALFTLNRLLENGTISRREARFLRFLVRARQNVLVTGGIGAGKTTLINALGSVVPEEERIIVLEERPELSLAGRHVLFFQTRNANKGGIGEVNWPDLFRSALHLRPDRLLVGEIDPRGAIHLLEAAMSLSGGTIATLRAGTPRNALTRLELLLLRHDVTIPTRTLREEIAAAFPILIHMERQEDGLRRIGAICEVQGVDPEGHYTIEEIFVRKRVAEENARMTLPTGLQPRFYEAALEQGIDPLPDNFFDATT
ncbi:MAG: FHA domain-containing protein [Deltaproteobacteria bacterium]|nr:MAG: FHA domain-containing protein [Deltaproteobacteria bacterium]